MIHKPMLTHLCPSRGGELFFEKLEKSPLLARGFGEGCVI